MRAYFFQWSMHMYSYLCICLFTLLTHIFCTTNKHINLFLVTAEVKSPLLWCSARIHIHILYEVIWYSQSLLIFIFLAIISFMNFISKTVSHLWIHFKSPNSLATKFHSFLKVWFVSIIRDFILSWYLLSTYYEPGTQYIECEQDRKGPHQMVFVF